MKRWETRHQLIGLGSSDQEELRILNQTLRQCKDGLVRAADVRHAKEVIVELGLAQSKNLLPAVVDDLSGNHADGQRALADVENQLYQHIVAKVDYPAHDRLDWRYATSCLASTSSAPNSEDLRAARLVGRYLRKLPVTGRSSPSMIRVQLCCPRPFRRTERHGSLATPWSQRRVEPCRFGRSVVARSQSWTRS